MSKRLARLNEQLKRELSELIRLRVRDPRVGPVTITGVDIAADLGSAKVYVRVVGGPVELEQSLNGLRAAAPFLRSRLGHSLHVRRVPELRFREDRSHEGARRIEAVLADVLPPEGIGGEDGGGEGGGRTAPAPDPAAGAGPDDRAEDPSGGASE